MTTILDAMKQALTVLKQGGAANNWNDTASALTALSLAIEQMEKCEPVADPLYKALASAWYYGNWKAETANERYMQTLMEIAGWWPITEERLT